MIPTEFFTVVGIITTILVAVYLLLVVPPVLILFTLVIIERILSDIIDYLWTRWGGTAEKKPEKYGDELITLSSYTKHQVTRLRRWYWEKFRIYDKAVLMKLPGL